LKKWPWRRILAIVGAVLIVVGLAPLTALLWHASTHNFRPLSMDFPIRAGSYTSPEFKTDLNESYVIQMEMMDSTGRGIGLNADAVLDLDWKIMDLNGSVIASGTRNEPMRGGNAVNLGEYAPKRGLRQKMIFNLHRDFAEPAGSKVTLEINSTEDPEGMAFGYIVFATWAGFVGGSGAVLLLASLILRFARPAAREAVSRTL
jgi:hypothetical protein